MTRKSNRGLGRGLDALLPGEPDQGRAYREVPVDRLAPNPQQPRSRIAGEELSSLADSIASQGILEPILVRPQGAGFEIVAGERRWRAAQEAGLARVPVVVREVSDEDIGLLALIENLQREELNPLEEAAAFRKLAASGRTHEQVAAEVGRSRAAVTNTIRLLELAPPVAELVAHRQLGAGAARALLPLAPNPQHEMALEVVRRGLSVREVERRVAKRLGRGKTPSAPKLDANSRDAERRMERVMGLPVRIRRQGKGGTVTVQFFSENDLERVFERLVEDRKQGAEAL